jgi:hypothetical protein
MESTQIEPAVQYGDHYLQITRQNVDLYHMVTDAADRRIRYSDAGNTKCLPWWAR